MGAIFYCFMREVRHDDFVIIPLDLKIRGPLIVSNVTSTRYDLCVYKQLGGGFNCMTYAGIITRETGMAL